MQQQLVCTTQSLHYNYCKNFPCINLLYTLGNTSCVDGELRLVNVFDRDTNASGVLEVCQGGVFGTVCVDLWNITNPRIACSELGYSFQS